ncbi:MAG: hypothetical protein AAF226_16350, partial [Verrucomicrobiota bacterium]
MNRNIANLIVATFAIIATVVVLWQWKAQKVKAATAFLTEKHQAQISKHNGEVTAFIPSPIATDLVEVSRKLAELGNVTVLDVTGSAKLESLKGVSSLPKLQSIVAVDCPALRNFNGLENHTALRELVTVDSVLLEDVSAL